MGDDYKQDKIIMNNILQLASKYNKGNQRNLLNKWFQDSIKNYALESIAFPLLGKFLRCNSSSAVKDFIEKNIDKSKPKYMSIMDQYFFQINKYNQGEDFKEKLQSILQNPKDYFAYQFSSTYSNEKEIRKQFVCYLILRNFEQYGQQDFPSFYELWNFCFPQKIQIKKKLSRFDPKIFKKRSNRLIKNDASNQVNNLPKSSMHIPITNQKHNLNQNTLQSYEKTIFQDKDHSDKLQEIKQEINYFSDNSKIHSQKKQINNHIFEDEEEQDYQPINSQQLPFYEEKEKFYEQNMCTQKECQDYDHQFLQLKDYNNQYFFDFETQHSFQNIYQPSDYQQFYQYQ
ncbi:hypothetical protein ABPG73_022926 [Tetrahymena malaccensis]